MAIIGNIPYFQTNPFDVQYWTVIFWQVPSASFDEGWRQPKRTRTRGDTTAKILRVRKHLNGGDTDQPAAIDWSALVKSSYILVFFSPLISIDNIPWRMPLLYWLQNASGTTVLSGYIKSLVVVPNYPKLVRPTLSASSQNPPVSAWIINSQSWNHFIWKWFLRAKPWSQIFL